ncbi:MAG: DUF5018 domain-containing protein, partial [Draconibacterium sp.]|nr:DUF5018 domain-containing protein [Draconibacterium sp.]
MNRLLFLSVIIFYTILASATTENNQLPDNYISSTDSLYKSTQSKFKISNLVSSSSNSNKIMFVSSMLVNKNSDTFPAVIDEQTIAGDPANGTGGSPVTSWTSSWNPDSPYPHYAVIDFGQEIDVFAIYVYDVDGSGKFIVESGTEGDWSLVLTDSLTGYNVWNEFSNLSVKTRFLRLTKTEGGARVGEIVVYGVPGNLSSNAFLSNLTVGDSTITGFSNETLNYNIELPEGSADIPVVAATTEHPNATITISPAPRLPGISTVLVTAENGVTKQFYTVSFTVKNSQAKEYINLNTERQEWSQTVIKDFYEAYYFDVFWATKMASLPPANPSWNGGVIEIGDTGKPGVGVVDWKNATTKSKKPLLVVLPSAGAKPGTGICPTNYSFIVASAMDKTYSGATIPGLIEAALAIQQMV